MKEPFQKDHLTGFFLREAFDSFLNELIAESKAKGKSFSIALIDLDKFKRYNDKFGHLFGDEVLKYAAGTFRLTFYGDPRYYYRYGGDEFVIVLPDTEARDAGHFMHQCIYNTFQEPFLFKSNFYKVTMSFGVASYPRDGKTKEELIKKADEAMYYSKRAGTNHVTLASDISRLKLRRWIVMLSVITGLILTGLITYKFAFRTIIKPTLREVKNIKITSKPRDLDLVILKNGSLFEGRVIKETDDIVILSLYMEKGQGTMTFGREEVLKIKHGASGLHDGESQLPQPE